MWRLNLNHLEEGNWVGAHGRIVEPVGSPHDDGDLTDDEIGGRGQTNFCPKAIQRNGLGQVGVGVEDDVVGRGEFRPEEQTSETSGAGLARRAAEGIDCARTGGSDWRTGSGRGLWGFGHFTERRQSMWKLKQV